jgi:hypothetical protein
MKTKILIEFDVPDTDDEFVAKSAASQAAYNFLTFCTVSGVNTDTDEVDVHVDGYGRYKVQLGTDHE